MPSLLKKLFLKSESPKESPSTKDVADSRDTLIDVMEVYGRYAFDTDLYSASEAKKRFQGLAKHIQTAEPILRFIEPVLGKPNWVQVVSHFTQYRSKESSYVKGNFRDLRGLIWSFVRLFNKNLELDSRTEEKIGDQVTKMKAAVEGDSIEELKLQAKSTLQILEGVLHEIQQKSEWQIQQLAGHLQVLRSELSEARRELEIDGLTKIYNRKALDEHLERLINISRYSGHPTTLLMMDIDHFKSINDRYGHQMGDRVLKELARTMMRHFPRKTDFVARYGGEEFAVVLEQDGKGIALQLGEKLRNVISQTSFDEKEDRLSVTISMGIAQLKLGETIQSWIQRADKALYEAKDSGRNKIIQAK